MKANIIVSFLIIFISYASAQNQIDSLLKIDKEIDKSKSHLIYDYRLPEWGYDRFYFDFGSSLNGYERTSKIDSRNSNQNILQLRPYYYNYTESESEISVIQGSLNLNNLRTRYETNTNTDSTTNNNNQIKLDFTISGELHKYFNEWFLYLSANNYYRYSENRSKSTNINNGQIYKSKHTSIYRQYKPSIRIGAGFGRIRNVTPVFRALRFNERLKQLKDTMELNSDELIILTDFLTRRDIYNQIYDRSNKYFYMNLPDNILNRLNSIEPWELMYLDETWSEILGNRLEGFEVNSGLSFNYEKNDYDNPNVETERSLIGLYLQQLYYHNVSTDYQIGISFYSSLSKVINKNTSSDHFGNGILRFMNLWNLTDKMLLELDLGIESAFESNRSWERSDNYFTDFNLRYFIENNLSLNAQIAYNYSHNWPENISFNYEDINYSSSYAKEKDWRINLSLRYYLKRGLY